MRFYHWTYHAPLKGLLDLASLKPHIRYSWSVIFGLVYLNNDIMSGVSFQGTTYPYRERPMATLTIHSNRLTPKEVELQRFPCGPMIARISPTSCQREGVANKYLPSNLLVLQFSKNPPNSNTAYCGLCHRSFWPTWNFAQTLLRNSYCFFPTRNFLHCLLWMGTRIAVLLDLERTS